MKAAPRIARSCQNKASRHRICHCVLASLLVPIWAVAEVRAAEYTSVVSGNYNSDATWGVPGNPAASGDNTVVINDGHTVTVTGEYHADTDTITVHGGGTLTTPFNADGVRRLAGADIILNGGTVATDNRTWAGSQAGSSVTISAANSVIDTVNTHHYATTIGFTSFGSLSIDPAVSKVTFTNSLAGNDAIDSRAGVQFIDENAFFLNHSVELDVQSEKAFVQIRDVVIAADEVLTKTGTGTLQFAGTGDSGPGSGIVVNGGTLATAGGHGFRSHNGR